MGLVSKQRFAGRDARAPRTVIIVFLLRFDDDSLKYQRVIHKFADCLDFYHQAVVLVEFKMLTVPSATYV